MDLFQTTVFDAIKELFVSATSKDTPRGIGHSPQSRAVYGIDVILHWTADEKGWLISLLKKETPERNARHFVCLRKKLLLTFLKTCGTNVVIIKYIIIHITACH